MKKYLLTLSLLGASFSFIGQVAAVPCHCAENNLQAPQIQGCDENEQKPAGAYGLQLAAGQCKADCDCAPGRKCSVQPDATGGSPAGVCQ